MKTAHQWAIELTHERISYGVFLEQQPELLEQLKKVLFNQAKELIAEVQADAERPAVTETEQHT